MHFTGGLRYGPNSYLGYNVTWPFAKLTAEANSLTLTVTLFNRIYSFEKSQIRKLSKYRGLLISPGIRVEHTVAEYQPFIVFWTSSPTKVKRALEELAYEIG